MNPRPEPTTFLPDAPTVRVLIERAIESLLQLLDDLDGDADLEPSPGRQRPACLMGWPMRTHGSAPPRKSTGAMGAVIWRRKNSTTPRMTRPKPPARMPWVGYTRWLVESFGASLLALAAHRIAVGGGWQLRESND